MYLHFDDNFRLRWGSLTPVRHLVVVTLLPMYKNLLIVIIFSSLCFMFSSGQCPDKGVLLNRLAFLKDSKILSSQQELKELRQYEVAIQACAYKYDSTHALLLQRIARLLSQQGDYIQAIDYTNRTIGLLNNHPYRPSENAAFLVFNYYNLAEYYGTLNKVVEKFRYYDSCVAIAQRFKLVDLYSLYPLLQKVDRSYDIGDYELCIKYASMGENLSQQYAPEESMKQFGDSFAYSGYFFIPKVNALIALKRYNDAESLLINKINECKKVNAISFLGSLYVQLATTQMGRKNYTAVIDNISQALAYNKKAGLELSCKVSLDNLGYYHHRIQKDKLALSYYKKALQLHDDTQKDSLITLNIYNHIANVYVSTQHYDSAGYYFQCAFDQIKKGTNESGVVNTQLDVFIQKQQVDYLVSLFIDHGDAFFKEYNYTGKTSALHEAVRLYRLTDLLLERIRTSQSEIQSKLFWRKDTHHLYEQAIEACIASGNADEAFYFFERSRAILLYDQLNEHHWLGESEIIKQNQLAIKVGQMEKKIDEIDPASLEYSSLQNRWYVLKEDQLRLQALIKNKNPLYFQNFLDTTFTSLRDIRKTILKDHQALVELFVGDSAVYSMVVLPSRTYFTTINKQSYDSALNQCIAYISNPDLLNREFNSFAKTSKRLYDLIFQKNPLPAGRIIISPDGRYYPFEALVTSFSGKEPVYFLNEHAVSYTYSARYLTNRFVNSTRRGTKSFMGIAPVQFPVNLHLSPLPGSNRSVEKLESFFSNTDNMFEEKATKNDFLQKFGVYQIIQIYTHSSDSSSEGEPVIYFADKPLYLSEISSSKQPSTNLIVLSACETGNGKFYQGEGVFSFNRAFAALGIPSCVNNLWSVDNESTYQLTEMFFKYLSRGITIDVALQKAKVEFINTSSEKGRLPYYWAAAILAGKTDAVKFKNSLAWSWIIGYAVLGILLMWMVARKIMKYRSGHQFNSATRGDRNLFQER